MRKTDSAFLLVIVVALCDFARCQSAGQPAPRPAYDPAKSAAAPKVLDEIHVDNRCRILPDPALAAAAGGKRPHPHNDSVICHLEGIKSSEHVEGTTVAGKVKKVSVSVSEQEFVLQNVTPDPVSFIVEYPVPDDWHVDSDPPPVSTVGQVALFRADAQPGQIIRLHVGMRHVWGKKAKASSVPPTAPASPAAPAANPTVGVPKPA